WGCRELAELNLARIGAGDAWRAPCRSAAGTTELRSAPWPSSSGPPPWRRSGCSAPSCCSPPAAAPLRLIEMNTPDEPAPWLHPHLQSAGASQLLLAGPPAGAASVLSAFGFCLSTLPLATGGANGPERSRYR